MQGNLHSFFKEMFEVQEKEEFKQRLAELEKKLNRTERKSATTRAQQILILKELGLLDSILKLDIPTIKKAKLLGALLNSSDENIKKDLSVINKKDNALRNSVNYQFLNELFVSVGLNDKVECVEKELNAILKEEEVKKNKK